jgi:two-component system sensor histidine kinase KdpD
MQDEDFLRPDPEKLLQQIAREEKSEGHLKIFFGMCAGAGKTYAMLESAHKAKRDGVDVIIGVVETHKRAETEELVSGLEIAPLAEITYRGSKFKELDLDGILQRKPQLVLIDELAHSNIPGSRHEKRYQDVLEILSNGIDVYTTLNVQHLESRANTVHEITGMKIRETVSDTVFERADDVELIDITPAELLQRLKEGKVYTQENSKIAIQNFFKKGNLTALREMALRLTAEHVDKDLLDYKSEKRIEATWKSGQRLMVAIGTSPFSANLIRWTRRLAYSIEAPWFAVYVDATTELSELNKEVLLENLKLAKELGAEVITTKDTNIIAALIRVAREYNITQIIVGKSRPKGLFAYLESRRFIRELISKSGEIDVYMVGGEREATEKKFNFQLRKVSQSPLWQYSAVFFAITLANLFIFMAASFSYQSVSMMFLFIMTLLPLFELGPGPIMLGALLSAFYWDYFYIPPLFTFHISKTEDVLMLIMFFIVASVSGVLSSRIRLHQRSLQQREARTSALYNLTKSLSVAPGINDIADIARGHIENAFSTKVAVIFGTLEGRLNAVAHPASSFQLNDTDWNIANWVFNNGQKAGKFTSTLPNTDYLFYPLDSMRGRLGVIMLAPPNGQRLSFEQELMLSTIIRQVASAVERDQLNELAKSSLLHEESEKLYNTLFNSISHELKTPITTIITAKSALETDAAVVNSSFLSGLVEEVSKASERLLRLVENFLDITRVESGNIKLKLEWNSMEDRFRIESPYPADKLPSGAGTLSI